MRKKMFVSKVLQMSATMIIFNISNLCYNIFISEKAGAESIGLFHLIMNVQSIGISLSVSGMSLTATRLMSDMPGERGLVSSNDIIAKCLSVCMITALAAASVMYGAAGFIADRLLHRPEAAANIRMLAPSLICIAISSVLGGYFTAFGKVGSIGAGRLCAEAVSWIFTVLFAGRSAQGDICTVVVKAGVLATAAQCISDIILWQKASRRHIQKKSGIGRKDVIRLCAPIAVGSFLRTGLSSVENLLIPARLAAGGAANALSKYGIIKGMSMPVLFFPSVFTGAFTSLIVPEIARRFSQKHTNSIRYISALSMEYILKFGFLISAVFFMWSDDICRRFFSHPEAGAYLHLLAVLPLFMFMDSVTDAILKGLDKQVFGLKVNIADAVMRVVLIFAFVPVFGIEAYVAILYVSEVLNLSLSFWKLQKETALRFPFGKAVAVPMFSLWCAYGAVRLANVMPAAKIMIFAAVYIAMCELAAPIFKKG